MRITRRKKPRHATRRLDLSAAREILRDDRAWCKVGIVVKDGASHYNITEDEVLVDVEMIPDEQTLTCRLGVAGHGPTAGLWFVPPVGAEVAVLIPDGEETAGPIIVGVLSTGSLPDGVAEDVTVIANTEVLVHDGAGGAVPLATKADVDTLASHVDGHRHFQAGTAPGPTSKPIAAVPIAAVPPVYTTAPDASGTTVLKGK